MPTYVYRCTCWNERELIRPVADRDNVVMCQWCTRVMTRLPAAPGFSVGGFNAGNGYAAPQPKEQSE